MPIELLKLSRNDVTPKRITRMNSELLSFLRKHSTVRCYLSFICEICKI